MPEQIESTSILDNRPEWTPELAASLRLISDVAARTGLSDQKKLVALIWGDNAAAEIETPSDEEQAAAEADVNKRFAEQQRRENRDDDNEIEIADAGFATAMSLDGIHRRDQAGRRVFAPHELPLNGIR